MVRNKSVTQLAAFLLILTAWLGAAERPELEPDILLIPDQITYNVGETVRLSASRAPAAPQPSERGVVENGPALALAATLRYAGEEHPLVERVALGILAPALSAGRSESLEVWTVPRDARTGRYEVDLIASDAATRRQLFARRAVASFAVHRKLVRIERIELDKSFYFSGDRVSARVVLRNLSGERLEGLHVEFADRHWPWITPPPDAVPPRIATVAESVALAAGERRELDARSALAARIVEQPAFHQYAVIVRDGERRILDIAFSPPVIVRPPGVEEPRPYPNQYLFPRLDAVKTDSFRKFYSPGARSAAIEFDHSRAMFRPGDEAIIPFSVQNPTPWHWNKVTVRASLHALGREGFSEQTLAEGLELLYQGSPVELKARFRLPEDGGGLYRIVVELRSAAGEILAASQLEIAANPLPRSILIFSAHQDDETAHSATIRAAVENGVPVRIVYFTSGDAGSCDRYYQRSCGPAEALYFGALRMEEARAALAHLGLARENIFFLGLPDGGSEQIWMNHVNPSNPYLSVLLGTDRAPYEGLFRPNLPYARDSVVAAAKELIREFQPEIIYTGHPDERHVDHRTNNWFVVKALQELKREGALPPGVKLLVDQVYGPDPRSKAPYRFEKHILNVPGEVAARRQEAVWFYQSQMGNRALGSARSFSELPRTEAHWQVLDWMEHEGWNE